MSGLFGLDDAGNAALRDEAAANPILPEQVKPGFFAGIPKATAKIIPQAAGEIARTAELAASVPVTIVGSLLSPQTDVAQKYFEAVDPYVKGWRDYFAPDAKDTGAAARVVGGLGNVGAQLLAGGGNPTLLLATSTTGGAMDLADQGVNPDVAVLGGIAQGEATALGFKVPFLGKTLPMRMASGAAGNLLLGAGADEANRQLLLATGYNDLAAAYDPLNPTERATDILVGGLFGAVHHFSAKDPISADQLDASLTLANARHAAIDTAPGIPLDVHSTAVNDQAVELAMGQLLRDEPVTTPANLDEATFAPRPAALAPSDVPPEFTQLDLSRAEAAPAAAPPSPIAANDVHVLRLPPDQQPVLHDVYARAAQAKPEFDGAIAAVAAASGGRAELTPLKSTGRAVDKINGDYSGDASRIKDVLRATVEVKTLEEAKRAIGALTGHPGLQVLDSGARDLLSVGAPSLDGYRDAKFNVRLANGTTAEVQINVKDMADAKLIGHSLYEERDALLRRARVENRPLTAEEAARVKDLGGLMEALYEPVWDLLIKDANRSGETTAPLRNAESSGNLRAGPSNATASIPPADVGTSATGTPSTSSVLEPAGNAVGSVTESGAGAGVSTTGTIPQVQSIFTSAGRQLDVRPRIVEAASLVTSDQAAFPPALQPRQRGDRAALAAQVQSIATNLQPELLGSSALADTGAPITGPGNVVESGNGRVMALRNVYANLPERAAAYRQYLESQGFDVSGFKEPVLVRERATALTDAERQAFATEANQASVAAMSPVERAQADAKLLDAEVMGRLHGDDLTTARNAGFVRAFLDGLPVGERNQLVDSRGLLSQEGARRLQAAILAKAYGGSPESNVTLGRLLESTAEEVKGPLGALQDAAPEFAKLRQMIADGKVGPEYDIAPAVLHAVEDVVKLKRTGSSLAEHLATGDMFSPTSLLSKAFYDPSGKRLLGRDAAGGALVKYARQAMHERVDQSSLFSAGPTAPTDILKAQAAPARTGDMFGLRTPQGGGEQLEPAVVSAVQLAAEDPSLRVATGNVNPDGSPETVSAAEALARAQQGIVDAQANARAFEAAVNCATQRGAA